MPQTDFVAYCASDLCIHLKALAGSSPCALHVLRFQSDAHARLSIYSCRDCICEKWLNDKASSSNLLQAQLLSSEMT